MKINSRVKKAVQVLKDLEMPSNQVSQYVHSRDINRITRRAKELGCTHTAAAEWLEKFTASNLVRTVGDEVILAEVRRRGLVVFECGARGGA